ncbi:MAG: ribose-phosphate diphosphokinase [Steroidobacteraceae bacterium]
MTLQTYKGALLFAPCESRTLGLAAAQEAGIELADLEERQYEGGEFKLRPLQSVRDRAVFVMQSLAGTPDAPIAQRLVRLLFLLQGLRDAGAGPVIAVVPYLSYARKDRRNRPRDPVYTRYVAQLLEASRADRLITLDVHNAAALDNAFRIPVDHLSALPMMAAHFSQHAAPARWAVASPDVGGIKRAQLFRDLLERTLGTDIELIFIEKRRDGGVVSGGGAIVGNARGRTVVILDDLCASGATLVRAAAALRAAGAASIQVAVTHVPVESGLAALAAAPDIAQVVTTDSVGCLIRPDDPAGHGNIPPTDVRKVIVLPIGPLLGCAMARMIRGDPLAPLHEHWPVPRT